MEETHNERWLGYELHDGLLQWIIGARLQLVAALGRPPELAAAGTANVRKALTSLEIALEEGRELIGYLELDQERAGVKFVNRLENFIGATGHETHPIRLHMDAATRDALQHVLSDTASWNVLRIVQQAIRNAIQHAGPTRIDVYGQLSSEAETDACDVADGTAGIAAGDRVLLMTVADQGVGFDLHRPTSDSNHFGLNSMDHRARLIGARLTIDSRVGAGCRVECRLPLD